MKFLEQVAADLEGSVNEFIEIDTSLDLSELKRLLGDRNNVAVIIDRAPVFDRVTLMHALYQGLRLPGYFGFNWDSLKDELSCLHVGIEGKGKLFLLFSDLARLDREDRSEFVEVVRDANGVRSRKGLTGIRIAAQERTEPRSPVSINA